MGGRTAEGGAWAEVLRWDGSGKLWAEIEVEAGVGERADGWSVWLGVGSEGWRGRVNVATCRGVPELRGVGSLRRVEGAAVGGARVRGAHVAAGCGGRVGSSWARNGSRSAAEQAIFFEGRPTSPKSC